VYVNNVDSTCGGKSPCYTTIQAAFSAAAAGDDIRIQNSGTPYNECADALTVSGTSSNPIVIESDNAASEAVLECHTASAGYQMALGSPSASNVDYVTIQNLVWQGGSGSDPPSAVVVFAQCWFYGHCPSTSNVVGIQILNNTFNNWGASNTSAYGDGYYNNIAVDIDAGYQPPLGSNTITGTVISGNTFNGDRTVSLGLMGTQNTTVSNNLFENGQCGTSSGNGTLGITNGIHDGTGTDQWPDNSDIKGNSFLNFTQSNGCPSGASGHENEGIHVDNGGWNGTIEGNFANNFSATLSGYVFHIEYDAYGWTLKNNIINGGNGGIYLHPWVFNPSTEPIGTNYVYNNTVSNITYSYGIRVSSSSPNFGVPTSVPGAAIIENNILYNNAVQIAVQPEGGTLPTVTIDYNSYGDTYGGKNVGNYDSYRIVNFSTWKSNCGCDPHSLNTNPQFVSSSPSVASDFELLLASPAINAGIALSAVPVDYDGVTRRQPSTIGAFEYTN
jgi:hypothetical protein